MTSIFQRSAQFLSEKRHASMAISVTYKRGADEVTLSATPGQPEDDATDFEGFMVDADRIDWILRAEDLVLDGSLVTPQEGDVIEMVNGSDTQLYIVRRDSIGKVFTYADEFRLDIRVRTIAKGVA